MDRIGDSAYGETMVPYRSADYGFSCLLPKDSDIVESLDGVALLALAPEPSELRFRSSLVIVSETLKSETSLGDYVDASLERQMQLLDGAYVIDREMVGNRHIRTLVHHFFAGFAIALEQWWMIERGVGYAISFSCSTFEYDQNADLVAQVVDSFEIGPA